jgi:broad-specificity NMP kinase
MKSSNNFNFTRGQHNVITPKYLRNANIDSLLKTNNLEGLNQILQDISQENFDSNEYFDFTNNEKKLIEDYQILIQYMLYNINTLARKNQKLNEISNKTMGDHIDMENQIRKQQEKIRSQDEVIEQLTNNCLNMEFLIKELGLQDKVDELKDKENNEEEENND